MIRLESEDHESSKCGADFATDIDYLHRVHGLVMNHLRRFQGASEPTIKSREKEGGVAKKNKRPFVEPLC